MSTAKRLRVYPGESNERIGAALTWYVRTGEFRAPRKGDFYLSGAIPCAYRAPNDLGDAYHIMRQIPAPARTITANGFTYRLEGPAA